MVRTNFVKVEQGSEEWLDLRRGRLTASHMGDVLAGKDTRRYQDYQQLIVMELLGYEEEEEGGPWFEHGKAMEPWARDAYSFKFGRELTPDVFFIHPEYDFIGASPDGVDAETFDDPVEIKCRAKLQTYQQKIADISRTGQIESCYRPQVQAQMWVMGVDSIEFVNYFHDNEMQIRKMHVHTVHRDDALISRIETRSMEFMIECYRIAEMDPSRIAT